MLHCREIRPSGGPSLSVITFYIEGISSDKEVLLGGLCENADCDVLCMQETHRSFCQQHPLVPGMRLVLKGLSSLYGSAIMSVVNVSRWLKLRFLTLSTDLWFVRFFQWFG